MHRSCGGSAKLIHVIISSWQPWPSPPPPDINWHSSARERERMIFCGMWPLLSWKFKNKNKKTTKALQLFGRSGEFFLSFFCSAVLFPTDWQMYEWITMRLSEAGTQKQSAKIPRWLKTKKRKKSQIVFSLSLRSFCKLRRDNQATSTHPLCFNLEFYLGQILSLCEAKYLVQLLSKTFSYKKGQYLAQINYKNGKEIWNVVDAFFPKENQPQLSECSRCGCEEDVWKNLLSALFSKLEDEKNLLKLRNVCCKKEPRESARSFCSLHVRSRIY